MFLAALPLAPALPRGDGHPVLVLPGLLAGDGSTLRSGACCVAWATGDGWGLGRNIGPTAAVVRGLDELLEAMAGRAGRRVTLVGWSLGGIYARTLARRRPQLVRQVVTLGSPFRLTSAHQSRATRAFQRFSHLHVQPTLLPLEREAAPLQVPATSIYSRWDGIVAWRACLDTPGERAENIEVIGSHLGLGHNPAVVWAVCDRLALPRAPGRRSGRRPAAAAVPEGGDAGSDAGCGLRWRTSSGPATRPTGRPITPAGRGTRRAARGPALGLLVHAVEADRDARRDDGLMVGRLSFDILGTMPVDVVDVAVRVTRAGRTIELVEATMSHGGRVAVVLRAWLLQPTDTARLEGTGLPAIPRAGLPAPVGRDHDVGRRFHRLGRGPPRAGRAGAGCVLGAHPVPLVEGEPVSPLARAAGLFDIANGITTRVDPRDVAFPNLDLTAHLFAQPRGEWIGFDTAVSFGPTGVGVTSSALHDTGGPIGTMAQVLTIRPRR